MLRRRWIGKVVKRSEEMSVRPCSGGEISLPLTCVSRVKAPDWEAMGGNKGCMVLLQRVAGPCADLHNQCAHLRSDGRERIVKY